MEKKYYSTDEYYTIDKNGVKHNFNGYVLIKDNDPYDYFSGNKLYIGDNYITGINLSNSHFDRRFEETLKLPKTLDDCTFAANDFLKSSVLQRIIANLEENNQYIFKNCIVPKNDLPLAGLIPVLSPAKKYNKKDGYYDLREDPNNLPNDGWYWSNINYSHINPLENSFIDNITDSEIAYTDKVTEGGDTLYVVFLAYKNKIVIHNFYIPNENIIESDGDPFNKENATIEFIDQNIEDRRFNKKLLNLNEFSHIDPNDLNSVNFKNIVSIKLDKNYLYVLDKELNGIFQYDISRCLSDRGTSSNKVFLLNSLQGKGDFRDYFLYNTPISVAAWEGNVAVLDKGNNVIKVYDKYFNFKYLFNHGAFSRQNSCSISYLPYDTIIDGILIEKGALLVLSDTNNRVTIDIFDKTGKYFGNKTINNLELKTQYWIDSETGNYSNPSNPIISKEQLKKIEFSYNNSNYYYIITDRRIIKLQLSTFNDVIGIMSYTDKTESDNNTLLWELCMQPWDAVQGSSNELLLWESAETEKRESIYPINKCFSICGNKNINADIIFNIIDNKLSYTSGKIHRWDNDEDKNLLYIDNKTGEYTYSKQTEGKQNNFVYCDLGKPVNVYTRSIDNKPVKTENTFIIENITEKLNIFNGIMLYAEPNIFKSLLQKIKLTSFTLNEILINDNRDYVNQITLNNILYKLYFNLCEIKKYISGSFSAGYSSENIMVYNNIDIDPTISEIANDQENFFIGENEQISIVLNRCFINLYQAQVNILKKIQTKFTTDILYNQNSYNII